MFQSCKNYRTLIVMGRKILGPIHPEASTILRQTVFPVLRQDEVVRPIRYDKLIILYENKMNKIPSASVRTNQSEFKTLRLPYDYFKNINSDIIDFVSLYQHRYYDSIQEINCVEGYNEERSICNAPSTAYSMESLLKKVGNIYISDSIK